MTPKTINYKNLLEIIKKNSDMLGFLSSENKFYLFELNNYKECIKYYELGKNNYHLNENNDDTHYKLCQNLARAYKNIGEIDKARDVYEEMYLKNESDLINH